MELFNNLIYGESEGKNMIFFKTKKLPMWSGIYYILKNHFIYLPRKIGLYTMNISKDPKLMKCFQLITLALLPSEIN